MYSKQNCFIYNKKKKHWGAIVVLKRHIWFLIIQVIIIGQSFDVKIFEMV